MCGITGILDYNGGVDPEELDRFTDALAHRGPDGRGTHIDGPIGLGHRRLAILDLSDAGKCPMPFGGQDGRRYWITFNGEVYNFLEIRADLQKLGHRFRSDTDTEVVAAAYAEWGEDCLLRFNGMWALAIWDAHEQRLFLARDRFGVKPLYYSAGSRFLFASEIKAFTRLRRFERSLNRDVAALVLGGAQAYEGTTEATLMNGVRRLQGGCSLVVSREGVRERRWWDTLANIPAPPSTYAAQVEGFREIFLDAVKLRMRSDVPIGTCLSGGIDSTAVASSMAWLHARNPGSMARAASHWQKAFIATFPGSFLDEREFADQAVRHISGDPVYWEFAGPEAARHLVDTAWAMEEVYPGIAVPVWSIYRKMRENKVLVSLDGHGGDELLCGYTWYLDWPMAKVNANLYNDFHRTLLPSILRNYDRCSMAHGIEVRMPFMDWRLVTYCFGLQASSKVGGGHTKRVLRDAMQGIMPERLRLRQSKIGFNSPMFEWYNGDLAPFLDRVTRHPLWLESPFWNGRELGEAIRGKCRAKAWTRSDWDHTLAVWNMLNLVIWQVLFVEGREEDLRGWEPR